MKSITMITILAFGLQALSAQVSFSFNAAISPQVRPNVEPILLNRADPKNEIHFGINSFEDGIRLGASAELPLDRFFLKAEAYYYKNQTSFTLSHRNPNAFELGQPDELVEKRTMIELPVSFGVNLEPFRVLSGFTVTKEIRKSQDIPLMEGFQSNENTIEFGWHTGVGLEISKFGFELRYHMNFSNYGDGLYYRNKPLSLLDSPGRILGIISYKFNG